MRSFSEWIEYQLKELEELSRIFNKEGMTETEKEAAYGKEDSDETNSNPKAQKD